MPENHQVTRGCLARWRPARSFAAGLAVLLASAAGRAASRLELFPDSAEPAHYFRDTSGVSKPSLGLEETPIDAEAASDEPGAPDAAAPAAVKPPFWEIENAAVAAEAFRPIPPGGLPPRRLWDTKTTLSTAVVFASTTLYGSSGGWNTGYQDFHFHNEHFFGQNTYAGGADKVSHFVISATLSRELALLYDLYGHTREQSLALSFGVTAITGLAVEFWDGITDFGFSWEDLTMDVLGSATGVFLLRHGLNDIVGFRGGKVPTQVPLDGHTEAIGSGYSTEIYSGDFKLAGLARRMQFEPGLARFLLTSITYQTKGYGYQPPIPDRQRLVGIELGLNIPEILAASGVPSNVWWGSLLYKIFTFFRLPYTSFGWRYDFNHHKWHGPDTGDAYY
jgi:uncharacterized protein YfiM (DUF2279 family)